MRWALSLAMLLLMFAGGLTLERRHKAASAVSPTLSDDQLFSDLSAMEQTQRAQSHPADPRTVPGIRPGKTDATPARVDVAVGASFVRANAARYLCLVEPAADRTRSQPLARAARTDPRHRAAIPAASIECADGGESGRAGSGGPVRSQPGGSRENQRSHRASWWTRAAILRARSLS